MAWRTGQQRNGGGQAPELGGGLTGLGLDANTNTPANPFRPPPGFMDTAPGDRKREEAEDPQARSLPLTGYGGLQVNIMNCFACSPAS